MPTVKKQDTPEVEKLASVYLKEGKHRHVTSVLSNRKTLAPFFLHFHFF